MNKQNKKVTLYQCEVDDLPKTLEGLYTLVSGLLAKAREAGHDAVVETESCDYKYGYGTISIYYERPYTQEEIEVEETRLEAWRIERERRLVIDEKKMLERLKAKYDV